MMTNAFTVQAEQFQGPLDLLLSLIQDRKLYINQISLAKVTDDYLAYISSHQELPMTETSNFVAVAATLLLIKSRSLLPDLEITEEEEESIEDLERRLQYYRRIRELVPNLRKQWDAHPPLCTSAYSPERRIVFAPGEIGVPRVLSAIRALLNNLPSSAFRPTAFIDATISLEEMITRLAKRIASARIRFSELSHGASRGDLIVQFLAILELARGGQIAVEQTSTFGDIVLESEEVGTPRYNA